MENRNLLISKYKDIYINSSKDDFKKLAFDAAKEELKVEIKKEVDNNSKSDIEKFKKIIERIPALESQNKINEKEIKKLKSLFDEANRKIKEEEEKINKQLHEAEAEKKELTKDKEKLNKEIDSKNKDIEGKNKEIETLNATINDLKKKKDIENPVNSPPKKITAYLFISIAINVITIIIIILLLFRNDKKAEIKTIIKEVKPTQNELVVSKVENFVKIYFDNNSAKIKSEFLPYLETNLVLLKKNDSTKFEVIGHTDKSGSEKYNDGLSLLRAKTVKNWFVLNGIDSNRLKTVGQGFKYNESDNKNSTNRFKNRRIEIKVITK